MPYSTYPTLYACLASVGQNRGREHHLVPGNQMNDFDPYAEPKFCFEQTKSPPAPRFQNNTRKEKVGSRTEFQDIDPHLTLTL